VPDNAPHLEIVFNDGVNWENNGGSNWNVAIRDCDAPVFSNGVSLFPANPVAGQSVTVTYDPAGRNLASSTNVNIHYGYNGDANWTVSPGIAMAKSGTVWTYSYPLPLAASNIIMCFNNGTTWDNNGGGNWPFTVTPSAPVPNGVLITNPAVATVTVAHAISSYLVEGTAGTNLTGNLFWTNAANGASGSIAQKTYWNVAIGLSDGDNAIQVSSLIAGTGTGISTVAEDAVTAYAAWTNGSNAGIGFAPWTLFHDANAGHFVDTRGWGLWSHEGTNLSEAIRPFASPLATGQTFRVRMQNGWLWESGGSIGIALRNSEGATLWQLFFNGGNTNYQTTTGATDIAWTSNGLDIVFTVTTPTTYSVDVQPVGGTIRQYTGTFTNPIAQFRAWSYNNGTSDTNNSQRDYFINNLKVTRAASGNSATSTATVHIIRQGDSNAPPFIHGFDPLPGNAGFGIRITSSISNAHYALYSTPFLFPSQNWQLVSGTMKTGTGAAIDLAITNFLSMTHYYRLGYISE